MSSKWKLLQKAGKMGDREVGEDFPGKAPWKSWPDQI